jgi:hypothetical protein
MVRYSEPARCNEFSLLGHLIHLSSQNSNTDKCGDQDAVIRLEEPNRVRVPSYRTEYEYEYDRAARTSRCTDRLGRLGCWW